MNDVHKYQWCVVSRGRLYVAHGGSEAVYIRDTVGGVIYCNGEPQ